MLHYAWSIRLIVLFFFLVNTSFTKLNISRNGVKTIVIDAGHGGHDAGCVSGKVTEKQVALSIALKLGKIFKEHMPEVNVIFTRKDDTFVELWERASIANKNNADIFLSIHCNASSVKTVHGTETYAMSSSKNEDHLDVAKRENSVILLEEDYEENYQGFDPTSPEGHILFSLYQNAYVEQSVHLASKIEHQFANRVNRKSRGVKQAGFVVLWKTTMPAVLIETGFLTNDAEMRFLTSDLGQTYIASGIYRAVKDFKKDIERKSK